MAKMPRWAKNGPILHAQLNQLAEGIEAADAIDVDTSTGLQITRTTTRKVIGLAWRPNATYGVVASGGIGAGSGLTLGKGSFMPHYKDDSGVLQPYGGDPEDVWNSTTATAKQGDVIQAKWIDDGWAWDVASCS